MTFDEGPFNLMAKWMPSTNTKLIAYAGYSDKNNKVQVGGITLKQEMKIGSFGYAKRFRRSSGDFNIQMNYSELFANISINSNYKFIARLKRDTETNKNIESVVGFEYENCCFALRLTGSDKNLSKYVMHKEKIYYDSQLIDTKEYDEKERIEKAKLQLKNIASAKLVITSRIHTALPAVAFGTPVLFLSDGLEHPNQKSRLDGMEQFFPIINSKDLREWETKFPTPFKTHLPFVKNIEKQIKDFLKE